MMVRTSWCGFLLLGIALLGLPTLARAQGEPWSPPLPEAGAKDWIGLTSGEWLAGEIKNLRNEELEFESDVLETMTLDWDDVREIRSPHAYTYAFSGRIVVLGTASMRDSVIIVRGADWMRTFARRDLISIVPGGASELDLWSANAHFGLVQRSGNTNQSDITMIARTRRAGALTRITLDYTGNFGTISGTQNVNNHNGNAKIDAFVSNRIYLTPLALNVFSDRFQNIDFRASPSLGVGALLVDTKKLSVDTQIGAGYQWTWFRSVQPGEDSRLEQGTLIPSLSLDWEPTGDIEYTLDYKVNVGVPEVKDTFHHLVNVLSYDLTSVWSFEVSFAWDRVENPRPGADGSVPKRDDFRTSFGLGIEL